MTPWRLILGLLAVLVLAAVGWLYFVDYNDYRDDLAARLSDALGRRVVIEGDLHISLGRHPGLTAAGVVIANAPGGSRPELARVGRLSVGLAWSALLRGEARIERIALADARLFLEQLPDGGYNWLFSPAEA
ncbi:MAG: AsmA family protein, partial [Alphaproteobacteria bacterium]|nr:AsmA family protein [Alphaproteobacteria bacterium]